MEETTLKDLIEFEKEVTYRLVHTAIATKTVPQVLEVLLSDLRRIYDNDACYETACECNNRAFEMIWLFNYQNKPGDFEMPLKMLCVVDSEELKTLINNSNKGE